MVVIGHEFPDTIPNKIKVIQRICLEVRKQFKWPIEKGTHRYLAYQIKRC